MQMRDVGPESHALPLLRLPGIDLMREYPVNLPSKVSNYPESRVRVILLIPLDVRFRGYLTTAHSPSMGIGEGPKNPASMSIYPKRILE